MTPIVEREASEARGGTEGAGFAPILRGKSRVSFLQTVVCSGSFGHLFTGWGP